MRADISGPVVEQLSRGLAVASRRHEALARNIANVETPGYRAQDVVFEDAMQRTTALAPSDAGSALPPVGPAERRPRVIYSDDPARGTDGNDVDLDRQMSRVAENTLYHNALVQMLASHFTTLKQAISGRV